MRIAIDSSGRIVIPKAIRARTGLEPGTTLEVRLRGNVIEIEPTLARIRMEKRSGFLVAMPLDTREKLTKQIVDETTRAIRERD